MKPTHRTEPGADAPPFGGSHAALAEALDQAYCVIEVLYDEDGEARDYRFAYVNGRFEAFTGLSADAALSGRTAREMIPDLEDFWVATYARVAKTGEMTEFEARVGGLGRDFEVRAFRMEGSAEQVGILFTDVTGTRELTRQRERLAEELEAERTRLHRMLENAPAFIAVLRGRDLVFEHVNAAYYQIVGHRPIVGLPLATALPETVGGGEGRDYDRLLLDAMERGEPVSFHDRPVFLQRTPGAEPEERFVDIAYEPLRNEEGIVDRLLVLGVDVTERTRSRRELADSERRFRRVVEAGAAPMAFFTLDGRYTDCNDAFAELIGFTREEILDGQARWTSLTPPEWMPKTREAFKELIRTGRAAPYEKEYLRKDGSRFWGLFGAAILEGDEGLIYILDVTESRRAQEMLRATADALPAFLAYLDRDLIYRFCNATYEAAFARPRDEIVGKSSREVIGPEAYAAVEPLLLRALEGEHVSEARWLVFPGFGRRYVRVDYKPRLDYAGKVEGLYVLAVDETQQVEIQEALRESEARAHALVAASERQRRLYETVLSNTPDLMYVFDLNHRFVYANEALLSMWGRTWEDSIGKTCLQLGYEPWHAAMHDREIEQVVATKRPIRGVVPFNGTNGRRMYDYIFVPVIGAHGEVEAIAGATRDVTERISVEEALRQANDTLEARVAERTAELLAANERLQGFTYHVSHDLRSPLRAISATSRIVLEDYGESLPDEAKAYLVRQDESATKLGKLIDDLLKLSRVDRVQMAPQPVDITLLARDAAEEALSMHPYSQARVEVQDGLAAVADPRLLRLALLNLVENAVKYSPEGGCVTVGQREDGAFFVSDEGIGIDPRYFERIFEPFQRLHRDQEFPGTGIGLSNVRQVIDRHSGQLWVESEPGAGSTFLFSIAS